MRVGKTKWHDEYIIRGYELAREGLREKDIAKALGIAIATLYYWEAHRPLFTMALQMGRQYRRAKRKKVTTLADHVYGCLPPKLQKLWKKINRIDKEKGGLAKLEALFEDRSVLTRQHLFLYALVNSNYSFAEACRKVGITLATFNIWKRDPDFLELVTHVEQIKKDFFESSLVRLVRLGDSPATIFANKTKNRDRGYGEHVDLDVSGNLTIQHNFVPIDALDLPLPVRKMILKAIRQNNARKLIPSTVVEPAAQHVINNVQ